MELLKMAKKTKEDNNDDFFDLLVSMGNINEEVEEILLLIPEDDMKEAIANNNVLQTYIKALTKYRVANDLAGNPPGNMQQRYNALKQLWDVVGDMTVDEEVEALLAKDE